MTGGSDVFFLDQKFSTPVFFWVENLTVYFFGSEKSARIFWGSNFRQANSSYAVQAKVPPRSESMISSLVFFWVHNIKSMYFFGCKILGSVGPHRHVYIRVPPWDSNESKVFYISIYFNMHFTCKFLQFCIIHRHEGP